MRTLLLALCIVPFVSSIGNVYAQQPEKKKIASIDDLPRHTYEVTNTLTELMTSEELFAPFGAQVRADIENDLKTYEIENKSTVMAFHKTLLALDMYESNYDAALTRIEQMRKLEDKQARRLTLGLIEESIIKAYRKVGEDNRDACKQAFSRYLSEAIEKLPWDVVQERIEEIKGKNEMYSTELLLGLIQSQFESAVKQTGHVSNEVAAQIIGFRYLIDVQVPFKEQIINVFEKYISANRVEKPNIWVERSVDLTKTKNLTPVIIAIWDTGIDTDVFPDQLFVNARERLSNKDDDNNGYVDDIHGIAYTLEVEKTSELVYHIADAEKRLPALKELIKGFFDIQAVVESPEATSLRQKLAVMRPEEVKTFFEDLMQFVLYIHGTHVAGIATQGNPAARILVVRLTVDYRTIPIPPSVARAEKIATMFQEVVEYFKKQDVRVVNMSWEGALRETEAELEANGIGKDAEERAQLAREIINIERDAMYNAIKNAPQILFVNSAGNENDDSSFEDYYPTAFDVPNVLAVGAVDQAGDMTSFTSFGECVDVYANGFEVESYIPGGERMKGSGTSMSSPSVANLAAKLLALEPSLTTGEVVALIKKGADRSEDGRLLLINPKRSVELLENFLKNKK
ncbi:MAG: S8 family serine peptidase [candidate division WOR-3 bacterium]|nr:MAG: S8 family serine peptidase [candidate division WOR-3 bacterium]